VSEKLPSREQALEILRKNRCSEKVIRHCKSVAKLSVNLATACQEKGLNVNLDLVEIGALLHDVGRGKTHTVHHAIVGASIAKEAGLPESVVSIIKRHVGGGITSSEAEELGWPKDNYMPQTLEEKIVCYADKLIGASERIPIQTTIDQLVKEQRTGAAMRVGKLHEEITRIIGEDP
jgi:uncharacterized protein